LGGYTTATSKRCIDVRSLAISVFALSGALGGCASLARLDAPPAASSGVAPAGFSPRIRFSAFDATTLQTRFTAQRADGCIDVLALSGGGAGGAFGAGALSGWTRSKTRPRFDIVTGVSTGALTAPFAFAGPSWDLQLKDAFTGGWSNDLLMSKGAGALFGTSVFKGQPLRNLVARFITPELLNAVAAEARTGRLLLAATTNLDTEETVVWDLGAIATVGGDNALALFRDVVAASASAPGVFPPVMIRVEGAGSTFEEMHVDGGVTTPFFVAPFVDAAAQSAPSKCTNYYVIVNSHLADPATTTKRGAIDIAGRSLSTLMNQTVRSELLRVNALAELHGANFKFTAVPRAYDFGGSANFDQSTMARLFSYGESCAAAGALWTPQLVEQQPRGQIVNSTACPAKTGSQ
jgi:predicted acylesterase/phospholipase RssA